MQTSSVYEWIRKEESRRRILMAISQPMTAKQIGRKTGIPMDTCSYTLAKLAGRTLVLCLNPEARSSRLYGLSEMGQQCQEQLYQDLNLARKDYDSPSVNWTLYGWACFSHRAAIIKHLAHPMQPSEVKRSLRCREPNVKISANNIRDVMALLLEKGIVQKVFCRKKAHPRYELTALGQQIQRLLLKATTTF